MAQRLSQIVVVEAQSCREIVDVSNVIRVATTGRLNSPDLWEINQLFGGEKVRNRIQKAMEE